MDIIGAAHEDPAAVHTIDVWYAAGRRLWVVERLSGTGTPVGTPHFARSREAALECLRHWMHAHAEAHLAAPVRGQTRRTRLRSP